MHNLQAEILFEGIEVAVAMKQRVSGLQAEGCDQTVDGLTHCEATLAQPAIVLGGGNCQIGSPSLEDLKILQSATHIRKRGVASNTL